jgi:hypothetical protein
MYFSYLFATLRHLPSVLKKTASRLLAVHRQTTKREHKTFLFLQSLKKLFFFFMESVVAIA